MTEPEKSTFRRSKVRPRTIRGRTLTPSGGNSQWQVKRIRTTQKEASDLKLVLDIVQKMPVGAADAISRMEVWMIQRIEDLSRGLTRENLNAIMREEKLFPETDKLSEEE